jgi:hypothetical protein
VRRVARPAIAAYSRSARRPGRCNVSVNLRQDWIERGRTGYPVLMSDWGVVVLGAVVLAAATQIFPLWTVQIMVVPLVVFLVLFGLLLRGAITAERHEPGARGLVAAPDPARGEESKREHEGRAA